jgi:hypothetical protein
MDAVTYPTDEVRDELKERWVPVQFSLVDPDAYVADQARKYRLLWTPLLVWEDERGREVRRSVGFLGPKRFLAECQMARGLVDTLHARHAQAERTFLETVERFAADADEASGIAPEALFWAGTAALHAGRRDDFIRHWHTLRDRYPQSEWWDRASFIDRR